MSAAPALGRLYGIGLGPGDPELLTVKAVRLIQAAPVISYFAKAGRRGNARGIVDRWLTGTPTEIPLHYPMTTEHAFDSPVYVTALAAFYEAAVGLLSAHLDAGRDVALLSEGDPLFYGSFMHMLIRLRGRYAVTLVPGVTGMAGCWAAAGEPMTWGDDTLLVLPGTLPLRRADRASAHHRRRRHHETGPQLRQSPRRGRGSGPAVAGDLCRAWHDGRGRSSCRWPTGSTGPRRIFR